MNTVYIFFMGLEMCEVSYLKASSMPVVGPGTNVQQQKLGGMFFLRNSICCCQDTVLCAGKTGFCSQRVVSKLGSTNLPAY